MLAMCLLFFVCPLFSAEKKEPESLLVVTGASGADEYGKIFADCRSMLERKIDARTVEVRYVGTDDDKDRTDRDRIIQYLSGETKDSPFPLWLVFIGHGTFDGKKARFNLRGPDLTAAELDQWLKPFKRPVVVVNLSSSSAPFINRLSGPGRVVVTATKSGFEYNFCRFGQYFLQAITGTEADLNKDDQTSLFEAFILASSRVEEFYKQESRLATETALIDDNGDGLGTTADHFQGLKPAREAKGDAKLDGALARRIHLVKSGTEERMSPEIRAERDALEAQIQALRDARDTFKDEDAYYGRLESLLVKMARLYKALDTHSD